MGKIHVEGIVGGRRVTGDTGNVPEIPMLPLLGWRSFGRRRVDVPSIEDCGKLHFVPSGRIALALALGKLGVSAGDQVLLPAYHCPSMVDPVLWLGATPVFYKIHRDTSPDLDDIRAKSSSQTRAVLAVHFFGYVQDLRALQSLCQERSIGLIEDCAHACFGESAGTSVGQFGDIAIASLRKFFPLYDGGALWSTSLDLSDLNIGGLGLRYEAKAALDTIDEAVRFGRLPLFKPVISSIRYVRDQPVSADVEAEPRVPRHDTTAAEYEDPRYRQDALHGRMSRISQLTFATASRARLIEGRRKNYDYLAMRLSGLSRARRLFEALPRSAVPYVFPLEIDDPGDTHPALQRAGVSMWRWEELRTDVCSVSNEYSQTVIQLPCHQELTSAELSRMVASVRAILG